MNMSGTDRSNILASLMPPQSVRQQAGGDQGGGGSNKENFGAGSRSPRPTSGTGSRQHKLKQRFTVIRKLGKGTYGKVQLAINKETGQEVAIKTIKKTKIENEQDLQRVRREIQIMSSIEHPHIIHIYEVFENKDKIVLVMQYAPGGELYEYVSQAKLLEDAEARRLFRQIATAIYYCHQNKICHRDLKLENILLDEKNNAKLADFGLSNVFDKHQHLKTFCGSPLYASPEIVQGSPYEGPEVDCWSLGVLLYTLVYGAMPFDGSNFKRLVKQISGACYFEPKEKSLASPLIRRLLCADPNERATILDICSDPWVNGVGVPAAMAGPLSPGQQQHAAQSHNSLLKVAQDMANLTPVRFDILLAPMPGSPPAAEAATANQAAAAPATRPPLARLDHSQPTINKSSQQQLQQQLDVSPSVIMEVDDETRAGSPVARYVVRDLEESEPRATVPAEEPAPVGASKTDEQAVAAPGQQEEVAELLCVEQELQSPEVSVWGLKEEAMLVEDSARREDCSVSLGEAAMSAEQPEGERPGESREEKSGQVEMVDALKAASSGDDKQMEHSSSVEREESQWPMVASPGFESPKMHKTSFQIVLPPAPVAIDASSPPSAPAYLPKHDEEIAGEVEMEVDIQQQPEPTRVVVDEEPRTLEAMQTEQEPPSASENQPTATGEAEKSEEAGEKPKKVKKKIITKRKKKVSKRELPSGEAVAGEQAEGESDKRREENKQGKDKSSMDSKGGESKSAAASDENDQSQGDQGCEKNKTTTTKASKGPGKVRIPDTFQASGGDATPPPTAKKEAGAAKPVEGRRQSALVAEVSQKIAQQIEQSSKSGSSSAANIQADSPQLSSVRVSDKKSEFERRASLAAAAAASTSAANSGTSTPPASSLGRPVNPPEPQRIESLLESLKMLNSIEQTIVEPVTWSAAREVSKPTALGCQLQPVGPLAVDTSCDQSRARSPAASEEANRRSPSTLEARDERSDSAETIKAGRQQSAWRELELEQRQHSRDSKGGVHSALKIDLKPRAEQQMQQYHQQQQWQQQQQMMIVGPAPIARSYKKVTFTKDGACITETGKIYSAQADDGTVRRIERKSKITHYPASGGSGAELGEQAAISACEETHVYDDDAGFSSRLWQQESSTASSSATRRQQPFERLAMPSTSGGFFDDLDDTQQLDPPFMRRSPFARHSQRPQQHRQQYQQQQQYQRTDSASSCSSGSTDIFDDIFDTWSGAISMFGDQNRRKLMAPIQMPQFPAAFGQAPLFGVPVRRHSRKSRVSGSLAGTPRCESVEPQFMSTAGEGGSERSSGGLRDWTGCQPEQAASATTRRTAAAHLSGYDSDAPFARPASSLGSARARFGSSNLISSGGIQPLLDQDPFGGGSLFGDSSSDPFDGDDLFRNIDQEHRSLRQRLAKQHKQLWKGSTPSLFTLTDTPQQQSRPQSGDFGSVRSQQQPPAAAAPPRRRQQGLWQYLRPQEELLEAEQVPRPKSSSGSHASSQQQQQWSSSFGQKPPVGEMPRQHQQQQGKLEQSQSSSSFLRRSVALDSAPTRRNTANAASLPGAASAEAEAASVAGGPDQLPPRHLQPMRRSISRSSIIASQMANMQLADDSGDKKQQQALSSERHSTAASFIELKRTSSSASTFQQIQEQIQQQQTESGICVRQMATSSSAVLANRQVISSSSSASAFWDGKTTPVTPSSADTSSRGADKLESSSLQENRESRIQSWLRESSGNLSTSSGSKSSASDLRFQAAATGGTSKQTSEQLHQQHTAQLYATLTRPKRGQTGVFRPTSPLAKTSQQQLTQVEQSASSALFSSASRQSMSDGISSEQQEQHHQQISSQSKQVQMSASTLLDDSGLSTFGSQVTKATSSTRVSKTFATRQSGVKSPLTGGDYDDDGGGSGAALNDDDDYDDESRRACREAVEVPFRSEGCIVKQVQRVQQQEHHRVSSSSSFSKVSSSSTAPIEHNNSEGLQWIQTMKSSSSRVFGDDFDADSLSGGGSGGDLGSQSSSSLLDQLRSRGYRSMINQRMVSQQHQSAHQAVEKSGSLSQTSATAAVASSSVVESSSSRLITSSSSATSTTTKSKQVVQQQQVFSSSSSTKQTSGSRSATMSPIGTPKAKLDDQDGNNKAAKVEPSGTDQPDNRPELAVREQNGVQQATDNSGKQEEQEVEEEMNEYVREAKASIKAHLDRMKETELFLKSMQQEEETMHRKRQELFLFNNLMLSTKLNGIRSKQLQMQQQSDEFAPTFGCRSTQELPGSPPLAADGHMSAPIRNGSAYSSFGANSTNQSSLLSEQLVQSNGFGASSTALSLDMPAYAIPASISSPSYLARRSLQCDDSLGTHSSLYRPSTLTYSHAYRDPLEPVQPLSLYSELPIGQPASSMASQCSSTAGTAGFGGRERSPRRRSRSRLNDQFWERTRRPMSASIGELDATTSAYFPSRARRSTSQLRPSSMLFSGGGASRFGQSPVVSSEYKSDYGCVREPEQRATCPLGTEHHDADDDDGMSAYRASSYVPKIVPQGMGSRPGRSYQRRSTGPIVATSDSWRRELNSTSFTSKDKDSASRLDNASPARRESSPASYRRRSVGVTSASTGDLSADGSSRLSELEQRLAENKRRREELLAGKWTLQAPITAPTVPSGRLRQRLAAQKSSEDRSELAGAETIDEALGATQMSPKSRVAREVSPAPSVSPRPTSKFSRPSRLESMEARIKRKSYCVHVGDCSPERTQLRSQQSVDRWRKAGVESASVGSSSGRLRNEQQPPSSRSNGHLLQSAD